MKKTLVTAVVVVVLCGLAYLCSYTVSQKDTVVVTQFGQVVRTVEEAGLHFKLPWVLQTVNRFDKRLNVFETQVIQLLLADKNPIIISCYVGWRIHEPVSFFQSLHYVENATQKLNDMVVSELGGILGDYGIDDIINIDATQMKLADIEAKLLANSNQRAKGKYGIEIVQIGIRRIAYPAVVSEAVYQRMASEREKEAERLRAEGREEASKIESDANRQAKEILAEAYKEAETTKGAGDKEAMRIYAETYGKDPEFFAFLKSLETYEEILNTKSTLILSTDSELFKYLSPEMKAATVRTETDAE